MALVGGVLAVEGLMHGPTRHRIFAGIVGCALVAGAVLVHVMRRRRLPLRRLAFAAVPSLILLAVAELLLRVSDVEVVASALALRSDPRLGHRGVANTGGADANGFRNPTVPARADVVCLGDSNTFGFSVRSQDAWPRQLAAISGLVTYNMSHGGYGPLQYVALAEEAAELSPRALVVALYLGNDLLDAYRWAGLPYWASFRDPGCWYAEPEPDFDQGAAPNLVTAGFEWLCSYSVLLASVRDVVAYQLREKWLLAETYGAEVESPEYSHGRVHTLLTPRYRLVTVDFTTAPIIDGLRITCECFARIATFCSARAIQPIILVLPTKESCYYELAARHEPQTAERIAAVYRAETAVIEKLRAAAQRHGLAFVDALPVVSKALAADRPCFSATADGHYNAEGCRVLAELVAAELRKRALGR